MKSYSPSVNAYIVKPVGYGNFAAAIRDIRRLLDVVDLTRG